MAKISGIDPLILINPHLIIETMLHFSKNLKYLRELNGLKQTDIQLVINFNRSTWNGYETGKSFPSFKDLIKIAEFFDISEADLIHIDLSREGSHASFSKDIIIPEVPANALLNAQTETIAGLKEIIDSKNQIIELLREKLERRDEK